MICVLFSANATHPILPERSFLGRSARTGLRNTSVNSGSAFVLRVCHKLYPDLVRSHLLSTFVGHVSVPHNLALKAHTHTHTFFLKSPQLHPHPRLPQLQHWAGSLAQLGLQVTRTAHRGHRVQRDRHSGGRERLLCSVSGPQRPRTGRTSNTSAVGSRSTAHPLLTNPRGSQSLERGWRPRPKGRARRSVGVSSRGTPLGPGYNFPELQAAAGGRRRAPGSGETGLAEGCCCRDSGGLRGRRGHLCLVSRKKEREAQVFPDGGEERCPRFPGGVLSSSLLLSPIPRTWTSRSCGWGFFCRS